MSVMNGGYIRIVGTSKCLGEMPHNKDILDLECLEDDISRQTLFILKASNIDKGKKILGNTRHSNIIGPSYRGLEILSDKFKTKNYLGQKGFVVTSGYVTTLTGINSIEVFPCVIKSVNGTGGEGIWIIHDKADLLNIPISNDDQYIVEEYIEGEEFSLNIFVFKNEDGIQSITYPPIAKGLTGKKTDLTPVHSLEKKRTSGISKIDSTELRSIGDEFIDTLAGLDSTGFYELEFIKSPDGKFKLIEVNPRPSGTTLLSMNAGSYHFPELLSEVEKGIVYSHNLLNTKNIYEVPIIHENGDFEETSIKLTAGIKIIGNRCFKKHPPYSEKFTIEYDTEKNLENFLKQNNL